MADIKRKMSIRHEADIAELFAAFGGHVSRASGATDSAKNDGRTDHFGRWNYSWDCKATMGQSIAVSLALLAKLRQDATGERPVLPLRFYSSEQLDIVPGADLVAFQLEDVREMLEALAEHEELKAQVSQAMIVNMPGHVSDEQVEQLARELDQALADGVMPQLYHDSGSHTVTEDPAGPLARALIEAQDQIASLEAQQVQLREERDDLARQLEKPRPADPGVVTVTVREPGEIEEFRLQLDEARRHRDEAVRENERLAAELSAATYDLDSLRAASPLPDMPGQDPVDIPLLPREGWLEVRQVKLPGDRVAMTGTWWDPDGYAHPTTVHSIRIEPVSPTEERLVVNDRKVRAGDLYIGGQLRLRVGA